ncbi:hypothetical protein [Pseudoxanthomonas japonensis]|uniref:hypothetical protein n=1 Tax=Pseudoxanthomonas japonensis TaxID=69284 RepID=UPI0037492E6A
MITFTPAFGIIESLNLSNTLATDAFIDAVRPEWEKLYPSAEQLVTTTASDLGGTYDSITEFNAAADRLIANIRTMPRGTWGFIAQRMPTNDVFIDAIISTGRGDVAIHTFTDEPSYAAILGKLQYDEIYAARQQYRAYIKGREVSGVLAANNWRVGTVIHDVKIDGTGYASVEITQVSDAWIVVEATTRSGREQHTYRINPRDIEVHQAKAAA